MADIVWASWALQAFTDEQRRAAIDPDPLDRFAYLPPAPIRPPADSSQLGRVDPDQMFADGFVYVNGQWVRGDSPEAIAAAAAANTGGRVGTASVISTAVVVPGGSVLGYTVPAAPPVLLPSFVGGRLGTVRIGEGTRPDAGGGPRVQMGPADLPVVRWR